MKYPDGQIAHIGDRVRLWKCVKGTVVCSLDTHEFSDQYPMDQWSRSASFPPRSTVYNIFREFQRDGVWEAIWAELHMALRERMGREASP